MVVVVIDVSVGAVVVSVVVVLVAKVVLAFAVNCCFQSSGSGGGESNISSRDGGETVATADADAAAIKIMSRMVCCRGSYIGGVAAATDATVPTTTVFAAALRAAIDSILPRTPSDNGILSTELVS